MPDIDFIIVGQGLAGSLLGYSLIKRHQKILIIDKDEANTSSKVAAGIFNPITGQRMALSWNASKIFPYLHTFYHELEEELGDRFFFPTGIFKPFSQIQDHNDWMGRSADSNYLPFIKEIKHESRYGHFINDNHGGVELNHSGYVNTCTLLAAFKKFFVKKQLLVNQKFSNDRLILRDSNVVYDEISSKKVIFCEGPTAVNNPFFNWLPFGLVKGEIITINMATVTDKIISKDIFILPMDDSTAKIGSTYDRNDLELNITQEAKIYLLNKLNSLLRIKFRVIDQKAGIRPATVDRRPFIGLHPEIKPIGLFNGLGTKGVSLGPYYADQFADYLVFNKKIDKEADLQRYIKNYKAPKK